MAKCLNVSRVQGLITFGGPLRNFRTQRGIGLLEVVVATGVLSILMYGVSTMIVNGQRGAQSVRKRLDAGQLGSFINAIFTNPPVCTVSGLVGSTAPAAKVPTTPDTVSLPTLSYAGLSFDDAGGANSLFDNGQIKILNLKYHSVSIAGSTYSTIVRLQVSGQGASTGSSYVVGGAVLAPQDFPLVFTVVGGLITACGIAPGNVLSMTTVQPCSTGTHCFYTYTWPAPGFVDANYNPVCQPTDANGYCYTIIDHYDAVSVTTRTSRAGSGPCTYSKMACIGVHP